MRVTLIVWHALSVPLSLRGCGPAEHSLSLRCRGFR